MNFGFIGTGNMATAIIKGMLLLNKNSYSPKNIFVYDKNHEKTMELSNEFGVNVCNSEAELAATVNYVFLVVKPHIIPEVIEQIKDIVCQKKPTIVSIAAGKTIEFLESNFGYKTNIIRVMPNVNAIIGESMSAICGNELVKEVDFLEISKVFDSIGKSIIIEEKLFSAFTGLAGSAPAYAYMFIDAMSRAGVRAGFDKKTAIFIAAQTVLGSSKTILESDKSPWDLVDMVCSPSGTTVEAVRSLLEDRFEFTVMKAVEAVIQKDSKL